MLNIRRATVRDAASIARVHVASWKETYRGIVPDNILDNLSVEARLAQWRISLTDPQDEYHHVCVAEVDDQIVGFANYGPERESDPDYRGELYAIYILRSAHRKGLGRGLVAVVAQALVEAGMPSMLVWVLEKNPARGFYEGLGGKYLREKPIDMGTADLREVAYGWLDIRMLILDQK